MLIFCIISTIRASKTNINMIQTLTGNGEKKGLFNINFVGTVLRSYFLRGFLGNHLQMTLYKTRSSYCNNGSLCTHLSKLNVLKSSSKHLYRYWKTTLCYTL